MKYLLICCLLLQVACQSSTDQNAKNVQANVQTGNLRQASSTEIPTQTATPASITKTELQTKGSVESHYITFTGIVNVRITDGQGNDNAPVSVQPPPFFTPVEKLVFWLKLVRCRF